MKQFFLVLLTAVALGTTVWFFTGCKKAGTDSTATQYTCPMHPQIITNAPGKCPICKMDLKPKT